MAQPRSPLSPEHGHVLRALSPTPRSRPQGPRVGPCGQGAARPHRSAARRIRGTARSTFAWGRPTTRAWRTLTSRYIEREQACVASFGTIADTQAERLRVWDAIGQHSRGKSGTIRLDFKDRPELAAHVLNALGQWTEDGLLNAGAARAVAVRARAVIQDHPGAVRPETEEPALADTGAAAEQDLTRHTARSRKRAQKKEPQDSLTFWTQDLDSHRQLLKQVSAWLPEAERKTCVKEHAPRQSIIQRRIVMELAHELDDDARERCTQQWCARNLAVHLGVEERPEPPERTT